LCYGPSIENEAIMANDPAPPPVSSKNEKHASLISPDFGRRYDFPPVADYPIDSKARTIPPHPAPLMPFTILTAILAATLAAVAFGAYRWFAE
jgi:hypothetical protein